MCLDHLYKRINGFQKKKINYGGFRELQGRFLTKNKLCIYIYIYTHYIFVVGTRAHVAKLQVPTCSTGYSNPPRNTWRNCKRQLVALVTPAFPGTGGETASANLRRWLLPPSQEDVAKLQAPTCGAGYSRPHRNHVAKLQAPTCGAGYSRPSRNRFAITAKIGISVNEATDRKF